MEFRCRVEIASYTECLLCSTIQFGEQRSHRPSQRRSINRPEDLTPGPDDCSLAVHLIDMKHFPIDLLSAMYKLHSLSCNQRASKFVHNIVIANKFENVNKQSLDDHQWGFGS
jgi:hypothetical protein